MARGSGARANTGPVGKLGSIHIDSWLISIMANTLTVPPALSLSLSMPL